MNKIKIIDLLNMISKGEEVPKRINYLGHIYNYDYEDVCYYDDDKQDLLEYALINCKYTAVNEEVEILDEPKENFTGWKMYQDGKVVCSIEGLKKEDKIENDKIENLPYYDYRDLNMETITQEDFFRRELQHIEQRLNDYHNKINEIISRMNKLKEE